MNALCFLLLGLFWSASFLAIKIAVTSLPPFFSALLRVGIAEIAFTIFFICMRQPLRVPFASAWRLWGLGILLQGLPFALLFWGEQSLDPALAGILNSTVAIWSLLFNILLFRDYSQVTVTKITGLILGMLGVIVIFGPVLKMESGPHELLGVLAITGMAICYALGGILAQNLGKSRYHVSFQASLWQQHCGSFLFLLIITLIFEHSLPFTPLLQSFKLSAALFYLGIFSTAIAWILFYHLILTWGALRTSTVLYMVPMLAILWDYLFLHQAPHFTELIGAIIILSSVAMIQFSKRKVLPPPPKDC